MRKHNPNASTYFTIDGATIEQLTIGGEALTRANFQIEDGGNLDMDAAADGVIVDPAGLALSVGSTTTPPADSDGDLADTGRSTGTIALFCRPIACHESWYTVSTQDFKRRKE